MQTNKLGELATYINGYAFKPTDWGEKGLPIIRIQDLTGNSYQTNYYEGKYPEKIEINNGDVLISWSASLGIYVWNRGKALLNQHIYKVVFDKEDIDKNYFVYAVKFNLNKMALKTHGATMKHIVKKDFYNVEVPFPSKETQIKISNILSIVESIIENRKQQLEQLDLLIKSRFVEMFGDISNKSSNELPMTELCSIIDGDRGKNYPKQEEFFDNEYCLFLNAKNVTANGFDFSNCQFITKEKDACLRKGKLSYGDIVLTTRGTIGNMAYYTEQVPFDNIRINSGMVILRMHKEMINEIFFIEQFKLKLYEIKKKIASGTAQPQLPISTMGKIKLVVPKIEHQKEFAQFVEQVEKSKTQVQKSLDETQLLFDSLMQEYFGCSEINGFLI